MGPWTHDQLDDYSHGLDAEERSQIVKGEADSVSGVNAARLLSFSSLGWVPSALFLWFGRALHLPLSAILLLGRFGNLFFYTMAIYAAIRIAPCKRVLIAVIGLMPINLFLASNYSYDPWLISLTILAFAGFLRLAKGEPGDLRLSQLPVVFVPLFLALVVKAVYFPLVGLLLLMPRHRFSSLRQRRLYYVLIILFGLYILASFAVPYLFTAQSDAGDVRGAAGVNASEQLRFILGHPLAYARTVGSFLAYTYLDLRSVLFNSSQFAYLNEAVGFSGTSIGPWLDNNAIWCGLSYPFIAYILLVSVLDREDPMGDLVGFGPALWTLFLFLATYVLASTALYVSFTPVGAEDINGMQGRYLLPWAVPFCAFFLNLKARLPRLSVGEKRSMFVVPLVMNLAVVMFCCVTRFLA